MLIRAAGRFLLAATERSLDLTAIVVAALALVAALVTAILNLTAGGASRRQAEAQTAAVEIDTEGKRIDLFERVMKYNATVERQERVIAVLRARLRAAGLPDNGEVEHG